MDHGEQRARAKAHEARLAESSFAGTARSGNAAAASAAMTAAQSATFNDQPISGPASAAPMGWPIQLTDIDTANARPNHAGSVRLCRSVKSPMSKGPLARPKMTIATTTTGNAVAKGSKAIAAALTRIAPNISWHSCPRVDMRPAINAETSPAPPIAPHRKPTVAGLLPRRSSTSTGTAIERMPQLRLNVASVRASPRNVVLRTTYWRPRHALRAIDPSIGVVEDGSGSRSITNAAAPKTAPHDARAGSGPSNPMSRPASGAPTS